MLVGRTFTRASIAIESDCDLEPKPVRAKSLVLYGPSRLGKTQWARSLGTHFYMYNMFHLDRIENQVEYGIFDDIPFKFFNSWQAFLGCQKDISLTDKYRAKRTVPWGKPAIYLTNIPPTEWEDPNYPSGALFSYIQRNCVFVQVDEPLY